MAVLIRTQPQSKRFQKMKLFQKSGQKREGQVWLNVTALVDMMTVLVIFLIMQFSATGEMLFVSKNLKMANAVHGESINRAPILSLNQAADLYYEGAVIAAHLKPPKINESWEISTLHEKLKDNQARYQALSAKDSENKSRRDEQARVVNVQIDKNVDFGVLKRVLYTCELAGFEKIRLAVAKQVMVKN